MLSFRRFQPVLLGGFTFGLLLFGLRAETTAAANPPLFVTVESAGWLVQGEMYELNGSATHPEDVSVSKIEMSFTAVEVSEGERWQLLGEVIWEPNPECESPPQMLCSEWQVSLDVSALPHSDYNLEVSSEFDPDYPVDIFGDDPDERCSYNCGDLRPTCTGGLCQHGGTKPEVWILPASPAFYAIAPTLEVS